MRSTGFVIVSILVHCMAVAAIGLTPTQTVSNAGEKIEVSMGEAADQPGVPDVPAVPEPSKPQAVAEPIPAPPAPQPKAEVTPKPVKTVQAAKPAKVTSAPKAKAVAATAATAPAPAAAVPTESGTADVAVAEAAEAPVAAETVPESKEILMPVKETAPAGVEAATSEEEPAATEAKSADVQKAADPSPVAAVAVGTTTNADAETGALAKGGASKEGAVSYMDLKQMPGNKSPTYPMKARIEKRQGSLELLYRVTKEGKVTDISVTKSSGFKDLDDEAMKAVANFRFVPGQEGWAKHPVSFNLKGTVSTLPSQLRGKGASID